MAAGPSPSQTYTPNQASGSLTSFYDEVVYWEMYKNTNRFFITFEKGRFGYPDSQRQSIATNEITYPHIKTICTGGLEASSTVCHPIANVTQSIVGSSYARHRAPFNLFFQAEERIHKQPAVHPNQGFIPMTELKGTNFWQSTLTSSIYQERTYNYEVYSAEEAGSINATRSVSASYFYPNSQYQLSVLRDTPTLTLNIDKITELPNGIGEMGYAIVPENAHPRVKDNLEYYLVKAGLMEKTTADKYPERPERGNPSRPNE